MAGMVIVHKGKEMRNVVNGLQAGGKDVVIVKDRSRGKYDSSFHKLPNELAPVNVKTTASQWRQLEAAARELGFVRRGRGNVGELAKVIITEWLEGK
jgi:hypothetical protein